MDSRTKASFDEVGCKSEEVRRHAIREVARSFEQSARELSHDYWVQFWTDLNEKVCARPTLPASSVCTCAVCTLAYMNDRRPRV